MSVCVRLGVYQPACKYNHAPLHESETSLALPSSICHSQVSFLVIQKKISFAHYLSLRLNYSQHYFISYVWFSPSQSQNLIT